MGDMHKSQKIFFSLNSENILVKKIHKKMNFLDICFLEKMKVFNIEESLQNPSKMSVVTLALFPCGRPGIPRASPRR